LIAKPSGKKYGGQICQPISGSFPPPGHSSPVFSLPHPLPPHADHRNILSSNPMYLSDIYNFVDWNAGLTDAVHPPFSFWHIDCFI